MEKAFKDSNFKIFLFEFFLLRKKEDSFYLAFNFWKFL